MSEETKETSRGRVGSDGQRDVGTERRLQTAVMERWDGHGMCCVGKGGRIVLE